MGNGYETETPKGIVGDGRQRNIHVETARALGAGFLEGLLSTPAFLRKEADESKAYRVGGKAGAVIAGVTIPMTQIYYMTVTDGMRHGPKGLIPVGLLILAQGINGYREMVRRARLQEED